MIGRGTLRQDPPAQGPCDTALLAALALGPRGYQAENPVSEESLPRVYLGEK